MRLRYKLFLPFIISSSLITPLKADFGDAEFPENLFQDSPKSYHDAWCRKLKNECRVRFQGQAMWVEGKGGIFRNQYVGYRYAWDSGGRNTGGGEIGEHYHYITYKSERDGQLRQALFLFKNWDASRDFVKAFIRWKKQNPEPIPNYRLPNSQGPQDTQGRDGGLNPYENEPIIDFMEITTPKKKGKIGNINCDSPVWKNKPRCN